MPYTRIGYLGGLVVYGPAGEYRDDTGSQYRWAGIEAVESTSRKRRTDSVPKFQAGAIRAKSADPSEMPDNPVFGLGDSLRLMREMLLSTVRAGKPR